MWVLSYRRSTPQLRITRHIRVYAAGEKFATYFPNLLFDCRGRNV